MLSITAISRVLAIGVCAVFASDSYLLDSTYRGVIRPASWSDVKVGMTRDEVYRRIGPPTPKYSEYRNSPIWMRDGRDGGYRYLNVSFRKDDIAYSYVEVFSPPGSNYSLIIGGDQLPPTEDQLGRLD